MAGQIVIRPLGQTTCVHHRQVELDWFCETCKDPICARCISTTHKGHIFVQLSDVTPQNKLKIKTYIDSTEQTKVTQIQQEISTTQETLRRNVSHFEGLAAEVQKQGEKVKEELDVLIAQTLSQLKQLEEENSKVLMNYETELVEMLQGLKDQLKQCKETLQIGTDIQVFDLVKGLQLNVVLPSKPNLGNAKFCPQKYPDRFLRQAIGTVAVIPPEQSHVHSENQASACLDPWHGHVPVKQHQLLLKPTPKGDGWPNISPTQHRSLEQQRDSNTLSNDSWTNISPTQHRNLEQQRDSNKLSNDGWPNINPTQHRSLEQQRDSNKLSNDGWTKISPTQHRSLEQQRDSNKLVKEWKAPCDVSSICPASNGGVWTCDPVWRGNIVTLLTNQAGIDKQIRSLFKVTDICTSPIAKDLWACSPTDNSVLELVSGRFTRKFTTKEAPISLCVWVDHVLVGTPNKITKYSHGGYHRTATKTISGKPLVCTPQRISQCPLSGNISVVDRDWSVQGGKDLPRITVMDKNLQFLHQYGREQHIRKAGKRPFDPIDLTYESQGRLVVSDFSNNCLYLLSGSGQYLRLIHTGKGPAQAVGIDTNKDLWAVFGEHGNQVIKRLPSSTIYHY